MGVNLGKRMEETKFSNDFLDELPHESAIFLKPLTDNEITIVIILLSN